MPKRNYDPKATYQTIPQASRTTGLSQHFFRELKCNGKLPHIATGEGCIRHSLLNIACGRIQVRRDLQVMTIGRE